MMPRYYLKKDNTFVYRYYGVILNGGSVAAGAKPPEASDGIINGFLHSTNTGLPSDRLSGTILFREYRSFHLDTGDNTNATGNHGIHPPDLHKHDGGEGRKQRHKDT